MSYQRVWSLVASMNRDFVEPLVLTQRGGSAGGGMVLTPAGRKVLKLYRAVGSKAQAAVERLLRELVALIRADSPASSKDRR